MIDNYNDQHKVMLLGRCEVGKTTIIETLMNEIQMKKDYIQTTGIIHYKKDIEFSIKEMREKKEVAVRQTIQLTIADTPGCLNYLRQIRIAAFHQKVILLVFDITNKDSFLFITQRWQELSKKKSVIYRLIGTHKEGKENNDQILNSAQDFSTNNQIKFFKISINEKEDIKRVFSDIAKEVFNSEQNTKKAKARITLSSNDSSLDKSMDKCQLI